MVSVRLAGVRPSPKGYWRGCGRRRRRAHALPWPGRCRRRCRRPQFLVPLAPGLAVVDLPDDGCRRHVAVGITAEKAPTPPPDAQPPQVGRSRRPHLAAFDQRQNLEAAHADRVDRLHATDPRTLDVRHNRVGRGPCRTPATPVRLTRRRRYAPARAASAPGAALAARPRLVAASPPSRGRRAPTCSVMSAPVAWSTTRIDSFTLPRSSKPRTLTFTGRRR